MAGGGLYALVAYGTQNVILSGNPQMTYFYKAFKRYSHFAMENITIPLEGPNEPSFDATVDLRAKIPRYGDLMSDLVFTFHIPDIYSKYIPPNATRKNQYEFQWIRYLGAAIINRVGIYIGGQKIQELDGSYILARALLDEDQDSFQKWRLLIGDTDALIAPAKSEYASYDPVTKIYGGYPTVVPNTAATGAQLNRPSIFGRDIHVPLSFWFSESPSKAMPLIGLQYHECEIQLTLNPINQLYSILDPNGLRVSPKFTSVSTATQNAPLYASSNDTGATIKNFLTDIGYTVPTLDTWQTFYPRLQANFIYLPREEQIIFATRPLSYIITQMTKFPNHDQVSRNVLDLQAHNPLTRMIFVQRRSDSSRRNDFANFTNWFTYPNYPFTANPSPPPGIPYSSGLLVPAMQDEMIRSIHVLCDGNEIQETKNTDFFTEYSPYKYAQGIGQTGLPVYSFQLNHSPTQPSGSLNASRIRNFQIDVDFWPLPAGIPYKYDVDIYVENLNFLEVVSGMGGLKYAL